MCEKGRNISSTKSWWHRFLIVASCRSLAGSCAVTAKWTQQGWPSQKNWNPGKQSSFKNTSQPHLSSNKKNLKYLQRFTCHRDCHHHHSFSDLVRLAGDLVMPRTLLPLLKRVPWQIMNFLHSKPYTKKFFARHFTVTNLFDKEWHHFDTFMKEWMKALKKTHQRESGIFSWGVLAVWNWNSCFYVW